MLALTEKIDKIPSFGKRLSPKLKKLGLQKVADLLFHFPFRYEDFSKQSEISQLKAGQKVSLIGKVDLIQNKRSRHRKMSITEALISDHSGNIKVIWFNQPFISKNIKSGDQISLAGTVSDDYGSLCLISPEYEKVGSKPLRHTQGLVPIYHSTANLSQKQLRLLVSLTLASARTITDWLPENIKKEEQLLNLAEAVTLIHFPASLAKAEQAKRRLSFDELFLAQIRSQLAYRDRISSRSEEITFQAEKTKTFVAGLPFELTVGQKKAAWEILQDIAKNNPMTRLLQGDVGCGKTITAVLAILNTAWNQKQSALMAPTEILATQHFQSLSQILPPEIKIALWTGKVQKASFSENIAKKDLAEKIAQGEVDVIVGTHALIQEKLDFSNLSLSIIDEQHRFGVEQRKKITQKAPAGLTPHLLSMTATPIPRSLSLAIYGDLDISTIKEMPKNRRKIITKIVSEDKRMVAYDFVRQEIKKGRQAFIVCPLIDPSDKLGAKSVKEEYEKLSQTVFSDLKLACLHGKLKPTEKEEIMSDFFNKKTQILISTSVVEVGIDIPNASIMLIEGAERFGLAQLHQFRGRVGRDAHQSYCLLLQSEETVEPLQRLKALEKYHSGFELAEVDLKMRGPGQMYGTEQKGFPELKIASLFDYPLIKAAKGQAEKIVAQGITKYPDIISKISQFTQNNHLE